MAKKKETAAKPRKTRKTATTKRTRKTTTRRAKKPVEEVIEPEDIETVEDEAEPEDAPEEVEVEMEVEIEGDDASSDDDREARRRRKRREFKRQFKRNFENDFAREFDLEDIFGANGPFGAGGPFGVRGIFGPGGIFNAGGGNRRRRQTRHGAQKQRRERMFGPGELRLVLLAMLAEEPRHGYELIKALEDMTGGAYSPSPGVIYPTLQMLNDEGVIEAQDSEDSRKLYQATEAGVEELEDRADEIEDLWERLGRKAERAKPSAGSSDVFRSLGNLATVLTNKAARGDFKDVQKDEVIDLIDALARKIERL